MPSDSIYERFHQVILGEGYSESAAKSILDEWFLIYLRDKPKFDQMLAEYEARQARGDDS
jgi:hypothetical protein